MIVLLIKYDVRLLSLSTIVFQLIDYILEFTQIANLIMLIANFIFNSNLSSEKQERDIEHFLFLK